MNTYDDYIWVWVWVWVYEYIYEHIVFECFDGFRWGYDDLFSVEMYINKYIYIYAYTHDVYIHTCMHAYIHT